MLGLQNPALQVAEGGGLGHSSNKCGFGGARACLVGALRVSCSIRHISMPEDGDGVLASSKQGKQDQRAGGGPPVCGAGWHRLPRPR